MNHVFISHASKDAAVAERLFADLRDVGHDVRVDLRELSLGSDTIEFMNDAIAKAHAVIIIFSENTPTAVWQKLEINAAVWNEVAQDGGRVIVLKNDDCKLPPLLGPKLYGSLQNDAYQETFKKLCDAILPRRSPTSVICEALSEGSTNPFWRVRAEYFEEMPTLLAKAFSPPDAAKVTVLEQMKPCFLEGSRGTGKTMLLLSLRARTLASRPSPARSLEQIFGFYVRLDRGAFCNSGVCAGAGPLIKLEPERTLQLTDTFAQEFHLTLLESLFSEISYCARARHISLDAATESQLVRSVAKTLYGTSSAPPLNNFDELLTHWSDMHRQMSEFVRRRFIYQEQVAIPCASLDIALFKRILVILRAAVPRLANSQFTVLLDEYENLVEYQKTVVNTLVKLGPPHFSVKVGRKVGTDETSSTAVGQELQEVHDYNRIPLVYSVDDNADFDRYLALLDSMVTNLLTSQGLPAMPLSQLLPADTTDETDPDELRRAILALLRMSPDQFSALSASEQTTKLTYYRHAAIYRVLYGTPGRRTPKRFSGHEDLAFMSSGVIRFFQEMLGLSYHLQSASIKSPSLVVAPQFQSEAVHAVSNHNLATLSRNVETHGEQLKYFLLDLGDCLRHRLLRHSSEPEGARIAIKDPQLLRTKEYSQLNLFLSLGVREAVFQTMSGRPGMRPKHVDDPQPVEINITRVFAPALQISPRQRWTTQVSCAELQGLLDGMGRRSAKTTLMKRLAGSLDAERNEPTLFEGVSS